MWRGIRFGKAVEQLKHLNKKMHLDPSHWSALHRIKHSLERITQVCFLSLLLQLFTSQKYCPGSYGIYLLLVCHGSGRLLIFVVFEALHRDPCPWFIAYVLLVLS